MEQTENFDCQTEIVPSMKVRGKKSTAIENDPSTWSRTLLNTKAKQLGLKGYASKTKTKEDVAQMITDKCEEEQIEISFPVVDETKSKEPKETKPKEPKAKGKPAPISVKDFSNGFPSIIIPNNVGIMPTFPPTGLSKPPENNTQKIGGRGKRSSDYDENDMNTWSISQIKTKAKELHIPRYTAKDMTKSILIEKINEALSQLSGEEQTEEEVVDV